jgi:hypothetical protein
MGESQLLEKHIKDLTRIEYAKGGFLMCIKKIYMATALVFAVNLLLSSVHPAVASSAVAFDPDNSVFGTYCCVGSQSYAENRAIQNCIKRKGRNCQIVVSCKEKGYGAIYVQRTRGSIGINRIKA